MMMRWVGFALQLLMLKKSMDKTRSSIGQLENAAFHLKKLMVFFLGAFVSALFLVISLVVAIVDLGLQIDRGAGIALSGLMISALAFLGISAVCAMLSALYLARKRVAPPAAPPTDSLPLPGLDWIDVADRLMKSFLDRPRKGRARGQAEEDDAA